MVRCVAYGCKNGDWNSPRKSGITFHRFPHKEKDNTRHREWIRKTRWENWTPSRRSVICSDHFSPECFDRTGQNVRLRASAVPTVFAFPSHLSKSQKGRKPPNKRVPVEDVENSSTAVASSSSFTTSASSGPSTASAAPGTFSAPSTTSPGPSSATTSTSVDPSPTGTPLDPASLLQITVPTTPSLICSSLSTPTVPRKGKPNQVPNDHTYAMKQSPRGIKRKLNFLYDHLVSAKKKFKTQNQRVKRLKKKVEDLHSIVTSLKQKDLVSESCATLLNKVLEDVPKEVVRRMVEVKPKQRGKQYSEELKAFAMTLHFYSSKAYEYVRKKFSFSLPHPRTLRTWYNNIDGEPGFTRSAFSALKRRTEENQQKGEATICSLVMDEMSIRKHLDVINGHPYGYVNIGSGIIEDADEDTLASEALVIMAVAVNASWKVPLGYFLIHGLSGKERANIVKETLHRLHGVGVRVVSVTCDGPSCNLSMIKELGGVLKVPNINSSFPHPSDPNQTVSIMLDVCHMLKLVRNTLGTLQMRDREGRKISWHYIDNLHQLQKSEGLHLANKIRGAHIQWQKQKMKVNLAAQVLSSSVADAIEYCNKDLHLQNFKDSEGTVEFLRLFDKLFDTMNSRNPLGKGYKSPMRLCNSERWLSICNEAEQYILGLTDNYGVRLPEHHRKKTGFLGFLLNINSVKTIFQNYVASQEAPLKYLLTYKLSQDHLELFFSAVRAKGGFNNNPTAVQFKAAYQQLLMRHHIESTGNCLPVDDTHIMNVTNEMGSSPPVSCFSEAQHFSLIDKKPAQKDHDYVDVPNMLSLSEYKEAAISYIAGYVAAMARKKTHCIPCQKALLSSHERNTYRSSFMEKKDRGGLHHASESVVKICEESEKCFQVLLQTKKYFSKHQPMPLVISTAVLHNILHSTVRHKIFCCLDSHMFDTAVEDNHVYKLIKLISQCYSTIRLHHIKKSITEDALGARVRKQLARLIVFKHQ